MFSVWVTFAILLSLCGFLQYQAHESVSLKGHTPKQVAALRRLQSVYLPVYYLAMGSDWLQGPYCYKLYSSYGFPPREVGYLFVAGYASSALMGSCVGGLTDRIGRKRMALAYAFLYGFSAVLKAREEFWVLMAGRIISGVSTSLLFSTFEAWMVSEHHRRGLPSAWLSDTFSRASFGNGASAIVAGLAATAAASHGGLVAPYYLAALVLLCLFFLTAATWTENTGEGSNARGLSPLAAYASGARAIVSDPVVLRLGTMQSLFEGAMYCFVFGYSPALEGAAAAEGRTETVPLGVVFSCFMACIMVGSAGFRLVSARGVPAEQTMRFVIGFALVSLAVPVLFPGSFWLVFAAFCCFELCCGVYFPCQGVLRSRYIDDSTRAGVLALLRIPLNLFVLFSIVAVKSRGVTAVYSFCCAGLATSLLAHTSFKALADRIPTTK